MDAIIMFRYLKCSSEKKKLKIMNVSKVKGKDSEFKITKKIQDGELTVAQADKEIEPCYNVILNCIDSTGLTANDGSA